MNKEVNKFTDFIVASSLIQNDYEMFIEHDNIKAGKRFMSYLSRYLPWLYRQDFIYSKLLKTKPTSKYQLIYTIKEGGQIVLFGDVKVVNFVPEDWPVCIIDERLIKIMDEIYDCFDGKIKVTGGLWFWYYKKKGLHGQHHKGKAVDFVFTDMTVEEGAEIIMEKLSHLKCCIIVSEYVHLHLAWEFSLEYAQKFTKGVNCCSGYYDLEV